MAITPAEVALGLFTVCNMARVFAYLPQILKICRDQQGAAAISYATWGLFRLSHLSTVGYAVLVVADWRMAVVFAANTFCCVSILGLTARKRALFKASQRNVDAIGSSRDAAVHDDALASVGKASSRLA